MKNRFFPSTKEAVLAVAITALFFVLTATFIGLRPEHFLMAGVFFLLFFAGRMTRKLAVALLPFFVFGISYDWMRVYPNYQVNPIDVHSFSTIPLSGQAISVFRLTKEMRLLVKTPCGRS